VTKFISHWGAVDKSIIKKTADDFPSEETKYITNYKLGFVLNSGQSSLHYDIASRVEQASPETTGSG
jgi:hypothetical protein